MDFIQTWCDYRYYCALHFDTSLIDLDLDSKSQECEKAKMMTLIFIQSCSCLRNQTLWTVWCPFFFATLHCINLDEIQYIAITYLFFKAHAKFLLHKFCSRERTQLTWFYEMFSIILYQDTCELICFKLGVMLLCTATLYTTVFNSSLNVLDVHTRSQGYRKRRTCAVIVL